MTHKERARKIANLINSQKFSGLLEDLLVAQFDEACEPWMHSVENLRRRAHDNEARIALLEARIEQMQHEHASEIASRIDDAKLLEAALGAERELVSLGLLAIAGPDRAGVMARHFVAQVQAARAKVKP